MTDPDADNGEILVSKHEELNNAAPTQNDVMIEDPFGTAVLEGEIHRHLLMHDLAARFFGARHFWFFVVSKGMLIVVSGALAFLDYTKTVGVIALIIAFLEALSESLMYGTRAAMHEAVSVDLTNLQNRLRMLTIKLGYCGYLEHKKLKKREMLKKLKKTGTEVNGFFQDDVADYTDLEGQEGTSDPSDSFDSIRLQFEQSLSGCKSTIPAAVSGAFDAIESTNSSLGFNRRFANKMKRMQDSEGAEYIGIFSTRILFNIMFSQITRQRFFPLFLKRDYMVLVEKTFAMWSSQTNFPNPFSLSAMNQRSSTFTDATMNERRSTFTDATMNGRRSTFTDATMKERGSTFTNATMKDRRSTFMDATMNERGSTFTNDTIKECGSTFTNDTIKECGSTFTNDTVKECGSTFTNETMKEHGNTFANDTMKERGSMFTDAVMNERTSLFEDSQTNEQNDVVDTEPGQSDKRKKRWFRS